MKQTFWTGLLLIWFVILPITPASLRSEGVAEPQSTARRLSESVGNRSSHAATSSLPSKDYSIADLQLPAKSVFPVAMPRYPNVWFYVSKALAPTHQAAVELVTSRLQQAMRFREFHLPDSEGCDFEGRLEHLQPWEDRTHQPLQHAHAFHLRYYFSNLRQNGLSEVVLREAGREFAFYRMAVSAHYEVEHTNPNHADVEICPMCGRTGDYAGLKGNLVESVHDPLGLELMTHGTIRGATVRYEDWKQEPVGSVKNFEISWAVRKFLFPGMTQDKNTHSIGLILLGPKSGGR
jgi:hypothetical protein